MARIDDIIDLHRCHRHYDEELWDLVALVQGRRLQNLDEGRLQTRLAQLDFNIQHLLETPGLRFEAFPEQGWLSPWYWFRLRHWTLREMETRGILPRPSVDVPPMPEVGEEFRGLHAGRSARLVRMSREPWLMDMLQHGRLRFAPATDYREIEGDAARTDDEMSKSYMRPGSALTITRLDGSRMEPLGDVGFATTRAVGEHGHIEVPYWLTSYSTDLDPRLFGEFPSSEGDDAAIVIFDPVEMVRRLHPHLRRQAPLTVLRLNAIDYYDAYHPPSDHISPLKMKDVRFAYQREFRLSLDPGGREMLAGGGVQFLEIGSIADIAAVYAPDGRKISGSGPVSFLA